MHEYRRFIQRELDNRGWRQKDLCDDPDALAYAPTTVTRLRRLRESRGN